MSPESMDAAIAPELRGPGGEPATSATHSGPPGGSLFRVLFESDELLVVHKPAGLVCHPTKGDVYSSLISRLRLYLRDQPAYLVNRLDRETSGVTVAAKSAEVAGELGRLFESRAVTKAYEAIVDGHVATSPWEINAPLGRLEGSAVAIQDGVRADGAASTTWLEVTRRWERDGLPYTHLRVVPKTGRKHQIRIHLAHVGHPIVGDKIYGGDSGRYLRFVEGRLTEADRVALRLANHALHAGELGFRWRGNDWSFRSEAEPEFQGFLG
jgi:23S rRNA pseudouridine1911/1915/1917 synthase